MHNVYVYACYNVLNKQMTDVVHFIFKNLEREREKIKQWLKLQAELMKTHNLYNKTSS